MTDRARTDVTVTEPLYARIMGDSWSQVAPSVRSLHTADPVVPAQGHFRVERGTHLLASLLAWMLRLPQSSAVADTRLVIAARGDEEHWERTFNGRRVETRQYASDDDLAEGFGILEFRFRLHPSGGSLLYVQREAALLCGPVRLRIPAPLAPRVEAREAPAGPKQVQVEVRVVLPGIGMLIAYGGVVGIEETSP
jgi:uncharacterized protein DUF4166